MAYFNLLPTLQYSFNNGEFSVVDMFSRIGVKSTLYENETLTYVKTLNDAKTPDRLSYDYYTTHEYYYILLTINNVYDVHRDWPTSQEQFDFLLKNQAAKSVYYLYENGPIEPNDVLYINEFSYGIVESWNPFYKALTIKQNYNLPSSNLQNYTFTIRRINKDGTFTEINTYCTDTDTPKQFNAFAYKPYLESISYISNDSGKYLNPFLKVTGGSVTSDLILDSCGENQTNFQDTLIYKLTTGASISGVRINTQEQSIISQYVKNSKIYFISYDLIGEFQQKISYLLKDRNVTANTLFRIG